MPAKFASQLDNYSTLDLLQHAPSTAKQEAKLAQLPQNVLLEMHALAQSRCRTDIYKKLPIPSNKQSEITPDQSTELRSVASSDFKTPAPRQTLQSHEVHAPKLIKTTSSQSLSLSDSHQQLLDEKHKLEDELLHVTRKLCRRYKKTFFPTTEISENKIQERADAWKQADKLTEGQRYNMYMESHYLTQNKSTFDRKPLEPRDSTNDRHIRHTQHTKYGDALAFNKASLRGRF